MKTRALVPMAEGCEEMEAVILIDVLRRAGWEVTAAGIAPGPVTCSRGVRLVPDVSWEEVEPDSFDVLVLPGGGPGAEALRRHPGVLAAIRSFDAAEKEICAICAAPLVLQEAGILRGREATCHPSVAEEFTQPEHLPERVVEDGHVVTSQGPGTAFECALTLVARRDGPAAAEAIRRAMVV